MIGGQLGEGSSLYGDYWVDRPPLLVALFGLASVVGGAAGVRALGLLAVVSTVLAAGLLGRLAAPRLPRAGVATAAVAAVASSSRMLGSGMVNGEVLAIPFALAGLCAVVARAASAAGARRAPPRGPGRPARCGCRPGQAELRRRVRLPHRRDRRWRCGAGRPGGCAPARLATGAFVGAAVAASVAIGIAVVMGSSFGDLWYAVVTFRGEATAVIAESRDRDTTLRFVRLLAALVGSGLVLLVVALAPSLVGPATGHDGASHDPASRRGRGAARPARAGARRPRVGAVRRPAGGQLLAALPAGR